MRLTTIIALLGLSLSLAADPRLAAGAARRRAAAPASAPAGAIATFGKRSVEAVDIERAARIFASDPMRVQNPAAWRRMLLDRCVDRELLSMEAERRRVLDDPVVRRRFEGRAMLERRHEINRTSIYPKLAIGPSDLRRARENKLYRRVDLDCLLLPSTLEHAEHAAAVLRSGAPLDSIAHKDSVHPTAPGGGHLGWMLVRDVDPRVRDMVKLATPGQIIGPVLDSRVYWIYRIREFRDLPDSALTETLFEERREQADREYPAELLRGHAFRVDTLEVNHLLLAVAVEPVDSITASLRPDGMRSERDERPALGVLARTDRDSVTAGDLVRAGELRPGPTGKAHVENILDVARRCAAALMPRLVERDAVERGVSGNPELVRRLRLARDGTATLAMVARSTAGPADSAALRAFHERRLSRFRRPPGVRVLMATFASQESAFAALREWNGIGISDSLLEARGFEPARGERWTTLKPRRRAEVSLLEGSANPLWLAARTLGPGQFAPVTRLPRAYVVAQVTALEEARPLAFEEAFADVAREYRAERENAWVEKEIERLRAKIPVRVVPSRLQAVKLGASASSDRRG